MGSSIGGLISLYAISNYPETFGGAACLSTHWPVDLKDRYPILGETLVDYFTKQLPNPENHRIYFDHGTEGLDRFYGKYQEKMDQAMLSVGYEKGENWESIIFEGADHNEKSWRARLDRPLQFLLGK